MAIYRIIIRYSVDFNGDFGKVHFGKVNFTKVQSSNPIQHIPLQRNQCLSVFHC